MVAFVLMCGRKLWSVKTIFPNKWVIKKFGCFSQLDSWVWFGLPSKVCFSYWTSYCHGCHGCHGYLFVWMWISSSIISPEVFQYDSILIWQLDSILTLTGCSGVNEVFNCVQVYQYYLLFNLVILHYGNLWICRVSAW